jgi:hypothetical protein
MIEHNVRRHMDERGYRASCTCGWRVTRNARELREQHADAHELDDTLTAPRRHDGRSRS